VILERQPGHYRQPDVEDQAGDPVAIAAAQELFGRSKRLGRVPVRRQHPAQRVSDRLVIVHDRDQRRHRRGSSLLRRADDSAARRDPATGGNRHAASDKEHCFSS
jgi:hypothetical protein